MPGFEDARSAVDKCWGGEPVSQELRPLLEKVYRTILSEPVDLAALKESLEKLLEFLQKEGRTNANCWATDMFFMHSEGWESDWTDQRLPDDFHDLLSLMGQRFTTLYRHRTSPRTFIACRNNSSASQGVFTNEDRRSSLARPDSRGRLSPHDLLGC